MQAETSTIKEILVGERRFVIPPYQRPYVWERSRQWQPLWDDLEDTVERLAGARHEAAARGEQSASSDEQVAPHFLGAIVLDHLATSSTEIDQRAVVDGQQRLTTTQLLLRGLLDALDRHDAVPRNLRSQLSKLLFNDEDVVTTPDTRFKVWPRRAERAPFRDAMDDEGPDSGDSRFAAARAFFADEADRWLRDHESPTDPYHDEPVAGRAGLLVAAVRGLLKLVVIDLDSVDDAQVIFEVLNARHTPLTASDLLKNLLFLQAENQGLDVEQLYDTYWSQFDDEWWATETGVGHATRARQDWLLGDWVVARSARSVNVAHLYGAAKDWVARSDEQIPDTLASIHRYAKAYEQLHGQVTDGVSTAEQRSFEHIRTLNVSAANPLLLWLLTRPSDVLPSDERQHAIQDIESYLIRRMAVKWQTRAYATVFVEVLRAAQASTGAIADAVSAALARGPHGYHVPSDEDLRTVFAGARVYGPGGINQRRLKILLGAVNRRLHNEDPRGEPAEIDYSGLTIEHIMPRSWESTWPLPDDSPEHQQLAREHRNRAVHRIGNLTLLTSSLNPNVSNGPWSTKRSAIEEHSLLRLNRHLCRHEEWTEQHIDERGRWLADQVATIWPRPAASAEPDTTDSPDDGSDTGTVDPDSPDDRLSDDDIIALHALLWETATTEVDERGWRLHTTGLAELLRELGVIEADERVPRRVRIDAFERLVGDGYVERVGGGESGRTRSLWVRPPDAREEQAANGDAGG